MAEKTLQQRKIGAHVSAAGGVEKAIERAAEIGCNCVQVFSGSPRVWAKKPLADHHSEKIYSNCKEFAVEPIYTHAIYLTNLASEKPELVRKSVQTLAYDLAFDALVDGAGVVVHLGSHQGRGWEAVREGVAELIAKLLTEAPEKATFLIENSAGQNGKLCSDLAEIRWLLDRVQAINPKLDVGGDTRSRLGWCLDTCHAFAAGYRLSSTKPEGGAEKNPDRGELLTEIEKYQLWSSLQCIHVNDSRDPWLSGLDRHANLGDGQIDQKALASFLSDKRLQDLPLILEVPGIDGQGPDAENVQRLRALVGA